MVLEPHSFVGHFTVLFQWSIREMIINSVDQFYDEKMYYRTLREIEIEYPPDKLKQYVENSMAYYDEMYSPHDRDYYKDDDE